jgi:hypothetical protein
MFWSDIVRMFWMQYFSTPSYSYVLNVFEFFQSNTLLIQCDQVRSRGDESVLLLYLSKCLSDDVCVVLACRTKGRRRDPWCEKLSVQSGDDAPENSTVSMLSPEVEMNKTLSND